MEQTEKILEYIDKSTDKLDKNLSSAQDSIFKQIKTFLKDLDLDKDGNIKRTGGNLSKMARIMKIKRLIANDKYKKTVKEYLSSFDKVREMNNDHFEKMPKNA